MAEQLPISLNIPLTARRAGSSTFVLDSYMENCVVERVGQESYDVVRRPGTDVKFDVSSTETGYCQGSFDLLDSGSNYRVFMVINNDVIDCVNNIVLGTMDGDPAGKVYSAKILNDQAIVFHNGTQICYIDNNAIFHAIPQWNGTSGFDYTSAGPLAAGIVYHDTYVFVLSRSGRLYNSRVDNQYTIFPPTSYLTVYSDPGQAHGITKHLNYIVAFKERSAEFYYDAGTSEATGSPLAAYPSAETTIGCVAGDTIVNFSQTSVWVGRGKHFGKSIYLFDGVTPTKVSTRYIDMLLDGAGVTETVTECFGIRYAGHTLYVLTLQNYAKTIVYDLDEQAWYIWSSYSDGTTPNINTQPFQYNTSIFVDESSSYITGTNDAKIYSLSLENHHDNIAGDTFPIFVNLRTGRQNFGSVRPKFFGRLEAITDLTPSF